MARPVANLEGSAAGHAGPGRPAPSADKARWGTPLDSERKVIQLVSRVTFGPRPEDLERVRDLGAKAFLDEQLHPERLDDSAVEARLANLPTLSMSTGELMRKYPAPNQFQLQQTRMLMESAGQPETGASPARMTSDMEAMAESRMSDTSQEVLTELSHEGLLRAVYSERQLEEVMVQFWMNHFNVFAQKGPDKWMLTSFERDTIRPHALGKFEDLLVATAQSPAMLFYLDNWMSSAPGSNPAAPLPGRREAFGGWRRFGGAFMPAGFLGGPNAPGFFNKAAGPNGQKRGLNENYGRELMELHTLGVDGGYTQRDVTELARCLTGWTIRRPREEAEFFFNPLIHDDGSKTLLGHKITAGGFEDGRQALHMLAAHPSTSRFISTKLCRRFVADNPPASLVESTSEEFARTNGDIRSVLKTVLTSPEFYSEAAYRAKVKSPFEMVASTLRALSVETDAARPLFGLMARMGEPPFRYQAPAGYADRANTWISSSSLLARLNFASAIVSNGIPGTQINLATTAGSGSPESVVDNLSRRLTGGALSSNSRQAILSSLQNIHGPGASAPEGPPTDDSDSFATTTTIAALVIGSPEFQMR